MTKILDKMAEFVQRLDAGPPPMGSIAERYTPKPPAPVPATKQLRTNLERVTLAYNDRERVLVAEIAAREAELADVRRARDATTAALIELEEMPDLTVTDEAPPAPIGVDAATGGLVFADIFKRGGEPLRRPSDYYQEAPPYSDKQLAEVMRRASGVTERLPHD